MIRVTLTAAAGAGWRPVWSAAGHAQGVTKTNILIGQSSPFSGATRGEASGDDIREGLQAHFKQVNDAGGSTALELIALDDANDARALRAENARILPEQRGVFRAGRLCQRGTASPRFHSPKRSKVAFTTPYRCVEPMHIPPQRRVQRSRKLRRRGLSRHRHFMRRPE
jgi:hypothetical protein